MKRLSALILLILFNCQLFAQNDLDQDLKKAKKYYKNGSYGNSVKILRQVLWVAEKSDTMFYTEVVNGLCYSLYHNLHEMVLLETQWDSVISLSKEYLKIIKEDSIFANPELQSKKYWIYKNLIVAHHGIGDTLVSEKYRKLLYEAKKQDILPEGLANYFNFEKIVYKDLNIWGYEWFAELGDKETEGSFSKHVYYIYSRDSKGKDKEQLYTLETVKIHKFSGSEPDFVLTKRIYSKDSEKSQTLWTYTFRNPIKYSELHQVILEFLNNNTKPETETIIKK
jgi:hypothetical protein